MNIHDLPRRPVLCQIMSARLGPPQSVVAVQDSLQGQQHMVSVPLAMCMCGEHDLRRRKCAVGGYVAHKCTTYSGGVCRRRCQAAPLPSTWACHVGSGWAGLPRPGIVGAHRGLGAATHIGALYQLTGSLSVSGLPPVCCLHVVLYTSPQLYRHFKQPSVSVPPTASPAGWPLDYLGQALPQTWSRTA